MSTTTNYNSQSSGSQDNTSQMLNDIQSLQDIEQQLFSSLEDNQNLTQSQQKQIIQKINDISNMRINLYQTLNNMNTNFQSSLQNSQGTLTEQTSAISIIENELNQAKEKLKLLEEEKNNKIRLIEINNYFGQKYAEHSALMKIVVAILFPILILAILNKKGILPTSIFTILVGIISAIGFYFLWRRIISIWNRDSMNYQEYNFPFNPNNAPTTTTDASNVSDPWSITTTSSSTTGTCIGDSCCGSGLVWDSSLNQCAVASTTSSSSVASTAAPVSTTNTSTTGTTSSTGTTSTTTSGTSSTTTSGTSSHTKQKSGFSTMNQEAFMNNVLTKYAYQFKKPDVVLGIENVQPVYSSSFINFGKF